MGEVLLLILQPLVEGGLALEWACMCGIIMGHHVYGDGVGLPQVSLCSAVFGRVCCPIMAIPHAQAPCTAPCTVACPPPGLAYVG